MFDRAVNKRKTSLGKFVPSYRKDQVLIHLFKPSKQTLVHVLNCCSSVLTANFGQVLLRSALLKNNVQPLHNPTLSIFQILQRNLYLVTQPLSLALPLHNKFAYPKPPPVPRKGSVEAE